MSAWSFGGTGTDRARYREGNDDHCGDQQGNAQELNDRRDIPSFLGNTIACADNLRDVMNSTAEEHAALPVGEVQEMTNQRIKHHRNGA